MEAIPPTKEEDPLWIVFFIYDEVWIMMVFLYETLIALSLRVFSFVYYHMSYLIFALAIICKIVTINLLLHAWIISQGSVLIYISFHATPVGLISAIERLTRHFGVISLSSC